MEFVWQVENESVKLKTFLKSKVVYSNIKTQTIDIEERIDSTRGDTWVDFSVSKNVLPLETKAASSKASYNNKASDTDSYSNSFENSDKHYKKGSLAEKANLVNDFNNKNTKR